ncbi:hypothetical protein GP486_002589 [Trichoglossum hirsutum]|uniref:DUF7924 domain-containing protein n=1 Tax=Trichoglossum hirsutum TaxID=265104 RepID=A0A9P8LET1_9PEZI|nr:hypothetical protein GP486_002589 [Trichoglossum hirsutum]
MGLWESSSPRKRRWAWSEMVGGGVEIEGLEPYILGPEQLADKLITRIPLTQTFMLIEAGQWNNHVPLPSIHLDLPPLPEIKCDFLIGYSESAFNPVQRGAIDRLTDGQGRNHARPCSSLLFPFFCVEFESRHSELSTAEYKVAHAGAVVGRGLAELTRRTSGSGDLARDYKEIQFFSLVTHEDVAYMHVHWVHVHHPNEGEAEEPHFEKAVQEMYTLSLPEDQRRIDHDIVKILDWAQGERLEAIRRQLDGLRETGGDARK